MHRIFDWEREQVFEGYDPVEDGFAYPHPDCTCTVDPSKPDEAELCDDCIDRLTRGN